MYRIGIDLGGTTISGGIIDDDYTIIATETIATPVLKDPTLTLPAIAAGISRMVHRLNRRITEEYSSVPVTDIGIGVPASVSDNLVIDANNLGLINANLATEVKLRTGCRVTLINDAQAAGLAEYHAGSGKGSHEFYMITLGTGVGGCYIRNGEIVKGCNNAAGEVGHMSVVLGGRPCTCGRKGCLEAYVSASALVRDAYSIDPSLTDGKKFFAALAGGSPVCRDIFENYLDILAAGLTNIINILQPDILAIGGGISAVGDILTDPLRKRVAAEVYTRHSDRQTRICTAKLNNSAGVIGAAIISY